MFRVTQGFRPSAVTLVGGLFMAAGALVYLNDSVPKPRNMHTFLYPALGLMAIGAIIAFLGAVFVDRKGKR
jgi:hypothetical protein